MSEAPIRAVLFGSGEFAVPAREALKKPPFELLAIVTQPDRPSGRGQTQTPTAIKASLGESPVPLLEPDEPGGVLEQLTGLRPDVIVVVDYGRIIPASIIHLGPIVNLHPSLLPKYRGATPLQSAILNGDAETGLSLIELDEKLDHGAIISQQKVSITADTFSTLNTKVIQLVEPMLRVTLPKYLSGALSPVPQDETAASYCQKLTKKDGEIDWSRPAEEILRKIRALNPWPGTFTTWGGRQLKILAAEIASESLPVGRVAGDSLMVGTAVGSLRVTRLQLEGKKPLGEREFLAGNRRILGDTLG